jgi:hypothetical protein
MYFLKKVHGYVPNTWLLFIYFQKVLHAARNIRGNGVFPAPEAPPLNRRRRNEVQRSTLTRFKYSNVRLSAIFDCVLLIYVIVFLYQRS